MRNAFVLTCCMLIVIFMACEKQEEPIENDSIVIVEVPEGTIIIGDTTNMLMKEYDVTVAPDFEFSLDINDDNVSDIMFESYSEYMHFTTIQHYGIRILDDNTLIHRYDSYDTTFIHSDTSMIDMDTIFTSTSSCSRIGMEDSIRTFISDRPNRVFVDSALRTEDAFNSDYINLSQKQSFYTYDDFRLDGGVNHYMVVYQNSCFGFPSNQDIYLGVKKVDSDKLGWIKFSVGSSTFQVMESAIQR